MICKAIKESASCLFLVVLMLTAIPKAASQSRSVSVNIPALLLGCYNIEPSLMVTGKISLHAPVSWSPHTFKNNSRLKHVAVLAGARWWQWHGYSGFFTGGYFAYSKYNISPGKYRYNGYATGFTFSAGYAKMLSRSWNIEAQAGVFLGAAKHDKFEKSICGEYLESISQFVTLPSRISLSLVYLF
jgi:hypothetical protein